MKSVIQLACKPSTNTLLACGLISNSLRFEVIGYCSTYARGIFASRDRDKNLGELLRDSMVVSTLLKMSSSHFIIRKKTPPRIFRLMRLTWLPLIFITGVHPPSPHPKSPIWQRTMIGLESRPNITSWLAFDLFDTKRYSFVTILIKGLSFKRNCGAASVGKYNRVVFYRQFYI